MNLPEHNSGIVNCLGAPWPEDLPPAFIDQLRELRGSKIHSQA